MRSRSGAAATALLVLATGIRSSTSSIPASSRSRTLFPSSFLKASFLAPPRAHHVASLGGGGGVGHPSARRPLLHRTMASSSLSPSDTARGESQQAMLLALAAQQEKEDQEAESNEPSTAATAAAAAPGIDDVLKPAAPADSPALTEKELRKLRKKEVKAHKRLRREGKVLNLKPCDLCRRDRDLLVRCQIDDTEKWFMVCGRCWRDVSGGVVDGDAAHPHYRYGGLWKAH